MLSEPAADSEQVFAPYLRLELILIGVVAAVILVPTVRGLIAEPPLSELWWGFAIGLILGVPGVLLFTYGFLNKFKSIAISRDGAVVGSWWGVLRRRQRVIARHQVHEVILIPPVRVRFILDSGPFTVDTTSWHSRDYDALESACARFHLPWRRSPPQWEGWGST